MQPPSNTGGTIAAAEDADPRFVGRFCPQPFRMAQVYDDGKVFFCCPSWLPVSPGSLLEAPMGAVWNSNWAQAVRRSILDGSYRYCSELNCPRLQGQDGGLEANGDVRDPYFRAIIDQGLTALPKGPLELSLAYDPTCNLSCPSCRNELFKCGAEQHSEIQTIHDYVVGAALEHAGVVTISTNGDPFASPFYLKILREFDWRGHPGLKLVLISNGLRLTPEMWESVAPCHSAIVRLQISVNAATPETFAINQRGGKYEHLLKNLEFIAELRRSGKIGLLALSFYVLDNNFREMGAFVQLAKSVGADSVLFGHVMKASSHTEEAFRQIAVHLPGHPLHTAFLEALRDPILQDPIVELFNNQALANAAGETAPTSSPGAGASRPDRMSWGAFAAFFQLDTAAAERARGHLDHYKESVAQLMLAAPAEGGAPPIALLLAGQDGAALDAFLREKIPQGHTGTYIDAMQAFELACRDAVFALLSPTARMVIHRLPVQSLMHVDTGTDPFHAAAQAFVSRGG